MSFFSYLLEKRGLKGHNRKPLWTYMLTDEEFVKLNEKLVITWPFKIDPRDVALYFSEWWKRNYMGGKPSIQEVFDSLCQYGTPKFDQQKFYKIATQGAQILGVKWIKKQNTLRFKSLLLQGGLPLNHISQNQSAYQNFLQAVLDEQPETIEDFIFNPDVIKYLPVSSQNEVIYENCFVIVKAILNSEDGKSDYEDLLNSNDSIKSISHALKVKKQTLKRRERLSKPQNYWLLSFKNEKIKISLRISLADTYSFDSLTDFLGFKATGREYQLYVNEELICVFRKMTNGRFKTDWYQQKNQIWDGESSLPHTYVINEGQKIEVRDFIQTIPTLSEPSLWSRFSDNEWRLIKGNGSPNKKAALLFPNSWKSDQIAKEISIFNMPLGWLEFEGQVCIRSEGETLNYLSEVNSFEWTITSQKPNWIRKASLPIVQNELSVHVYDKNGKILQPNRYKLSFNKYKSCEDWETHSPNRVIPFGCIDVKIEKDGLIAYDSCFNIANLQVDYLDQSIDKAKIKISNLAPLEFRLKESEVFEIEYQENIYSLAVKPEFSKIPRGIKGSIGQRNQKKLYLELTSPFEGMAITDKDGRIIEKSEALSISNLYGLRILSSPQTETILRMKNSLKREVIITKVIKEGSQPLISFKDEITRLFYLEDAMNLQNKVSLELKDDKITESYEVSGFSHRLNIVEPIANQVSLENESEELDLYAIPLACQPEQVELIPLTKEEENYKIPTETTIKQFVVISSQNDGRQLKPTFVNTVENHEVIERHEHIEHYHKRLREESFEDEMWRELLAYFTICVKSDVPISTFYQIRAISRSSQVAARAFFYLGINYEDPDYYIQKIVPDLEKMLGICFHWAKKEDWENALNESAKTYGEQFFWRVYQISSSIYARKRFRRIVEIYWWPKD